MLNDTHQLVRGYVDEAFQQRSPEAPLGDVLARVYHSLRNSMHVSAISEPAEIEVAEVGLLGGTVVNLLHQGLVKVLTDVGLVMGEQTPRPALLPAKPIWARPSSLELPPSFVWEPPPSSERLTAAAG